jgi:hypothetical protein
MILQGLWQALENSALGQYIAASTWAFPTIETIHVIAVITGLLLFISKATTYIVNPFFLWKMVLIALAGVNMGVFHVLTWRTINQWDAKPQVPTAAKLAGATSLGFWIVVVFVARAIGFTLDKYSQS